MYKYPAIFTILSAALLAVTGCTVHPPGEQAERNAAIAAGQPFMAPVGQRQVPPLPDHSTPGDLVRYALLTNAELEQRYWEWRAAIEQIPQDGTQPTNLAISAGTTISKGKIPPESTILTALNDPMGDIVFPEKLSVAARRALENAHAAGLRFQQAKFDLRNKVLDAYYDYALIGQLIQLEQANAELLQTTVTVAAARNRAGAAGQQDLLVSRNELDLSRNDIANLQSQLPAQRAALNALLNRDVRAPIWLPGQLSPSPPISYSDDQLLALAATNNPELSALASEVHGRADGIQLAKLQYLPDFSLSGGTDLAGLTQTLTGMITVPLLRYQAINAAIAQAQAELNSTEAQRRQTHSDLNSQIILDLTTLHDADRQLSLFQQTLLPRARQAVVLARSSYESAQSTLLDLLDTQRSLIALQRLVADLQTVREKRVADLEAIIGRSIAGVGGDAHQ